MAEVTSKCSNCQTVLKFAVKGTSETVRVQCPRCKHSFSVKVRKSDPSPTPANPLDLLTPQDLSGPAYPPSGSRGSNYPASQYPSYPTSSGGYSPTSSTGSQPWSAPAARRSGNKSSLKPILWALGGISIAVIVGLAGVGLYLSRDKIASIASAASTAIGLETHETVIKDMERLQNEVESVGSAIPQADRASKAQELENRFAPEFDAIAQRSKRLPITQKTISDFLQFQQVSSDHKRQLNQQIASGVAPSGFWHLDLTSTDPWKKMLVRLSDRAFTVTAFSNALTEYPDPRQYKGTDVAWTEEDRRVLAATWMQGSVLGKTIATVGPLINSSNVSDEELKPLFEFMDQIVDQGLELSKLPSAQGKIRIDVPRNAPYEFRKRNCDQAIRILRQDLKSSSNQDRHSLLAALQIAESLGSALEDIQFGDANPIERMAPMNMWEGFVKVRELAIAKEQEEKLEQERKRKEEEEKERKRIEAEDKRQREAEEKRRADEEARARRMQEEQNKPAPSNPSDGRGGSGPGRPFGPGPFGPGPMGPGQMGPGQMGPGQMGPGQMGPGQMGPGPRGPGQMGPSQPGQGQLGQGQPGQMGPGGQVPGMAPFTPGTPPPMSEKAITIEIAEINDKQFQAVKADLENFPNKSWNMSDKRVTIKINDFLLPLSEVEVYFPSLKIISIDEKTRTLKASPKN